jgi:2TM domain
MSHDLDYDEIRARAEKRVKQRAEFYQHLVIYLVTNAMLWLLFILISVLTSGGGGPLVVPLLSTLGWGIGIAIHGIVVYIDTTAIDAMREREVQREIERELRRRGIDDPAALYDKPKRDQAMRLSDDGELIPDDAQSKRVRNRGKD